MGKFQAILYGTSEATSRITITNKLCLLSDLNSQTDLISISMDCYKVNPVWEAYGESEEGVGGQLNDAYNYRDVFRLEPCEIAQSAFESPYEKIRSILNLKKKYLEFTYTWDFDDHKANAKVFPIAITEIGVEPDGANKILSITAKRKL